MLFSLSSWLGKLCASLISRYSSMRLFILVLVSTSLILAQEIPPQSVIDGVFPPPQKVSGDDLIPGYEEVTKKPTPGGFGALDKCGQGKTAKTHICIVYHMCDGLTNTVIKKPDNTQNTNGFGLIDIRFGENKCEHPLDVCCKLGIDDDTTISSSESPVVTPIVPTPTIPTVKPVPKPSHCGIRNNNGVDFKITGNNDNEAEYGEFPWMVAIVRFNYDAAFHDSFALCGGAILARNVILTGAHCVNIWQPSEIIVRAGEWDTQTTRERLPYQERNVSKIIMHEDFHPKTLYNDVALLILEEPLDFQEHISPICLPKQDEYINSEECYVTGWGKDRFGREGAYQVILKKIDLPLVHREQCESALRTTRLGKFFNLHPSFVCAGGKAGKDTCLGDGGGPLVCPDPNNPHRYVEAGIVAWGIGCGEANIPGVYVDVTKFRDWIDDQLERLNINSNSYTI